MSNILKSAIVLGILIVWMISGSIESEQSVESSASGGDPVPDDMLISLSNAQPFRPPTRIRGQTEAKRAVSVIARTSGPVASIAVKSGDYVREGQLMCTISAEEREADLREAAAALESSQVDLRGISELAGQGLSSALEVKRAEAQSKAAQARFDRVSLQLAHTEIRAPFAGFVEEMQAEVGALLGNGQACAFLIDLNPLIVRGALPEAELGRIVVGLPVDVKLASGLRAQGAISHVARSGDESTRTFVVEAEIPNPQYRISAGLTADLTIRGEPINAHLIPASALVLSDAGALSIRTLDESDIVETWPIRILEQDSEGIWVVGLPRQAKVITRGQNYVSDGVVSSWRTEEKSGG